MYDFSVHGVDLSHGEDLTAWTICTTNEELKNLALALLAGAQAIESNRRLQGASYARGFTTMKQPDLLPYHKVHEILQEYGQRLLAVLEEGAQI